MSLIERIKQHEGLRLKPYRCTADKLTIGYGRNLEDNGITNEEAEILLLHDIEKAEKQAWGFVWYGSLSENRKDVIVEMIFQLGLGGVKKFKKMIAAIEVKDFDEASKQMLDSRWHNQTPKRAEALSNLMREG